MLVILVGNCCTWTKNLATSYIINDDLILDVPQGSFKTLYNDYRLDNVKYILISHFHSDHFADLHLLVDVLARQDKKYVIVAPKGCRERLYSLFNAFDVPHLKNYVEEKFEIKECENGKTFNLGKYKIRSYKMTHGSLDAYGYVIDDGTIKVGFSGDSCMCNSLIKIIKKCKAVFIDTSNIQKNLKHLTIDEVKTLSKEYKDVSFYPVHLSTLTLPLIKESGLNETYQGQVIEIN